MNSAIAPAVTFLAVLFGVAGIYSLALDMFLRDRMKVKARLEEEMRERQRKRAKQSMLKSLNATELNEISEAGSERLTYRQRLQELLDQAGLVVTTTVIGQYSLACAVSLGLLAGLLRGSVVLGLIVAVIGAMLPIWIIRRIRNHRQAALRSQLAEAFELMSSTLRAGQSMAQSMLAVATDFPSPIADEFMLCFEQQNLGLDPEVAMRQLARRTGLLELRIFVVAVLVQRQVGGNLSEILQGLAHVVRERFRTQALIQTLTAEGRLQAVILMALAPFLLLMMVFMNRDYMQSLLDTPMLLVAMAVLQGIGWLWIRKIVNFDF